MLNLEFFYDIIFKNPKGIKERKMAKKKKFKLDLGTILIGASVLLAIVAICLLAAPAATIKDTEITYSCANLVFGYTEKGSFSSIDIFDFSFMNLLPYILLLVGIVLSVLSGMKGGKLLSLLAAACYIVAGVLFFLMITMSLPSIGGDAATEIKEIYVLGAGAVVSGILAIIAGLLNVGRILVK